MSFNLSAGNIIAGLVFSGVGFVAFAYGKKSGDFQTMALGGVLMVYSIFTPSTFWTCAIGAALTVWLLFRRD